MRGHAFWTFAVIATAGLMFTGCSTPAQTGDANPTTWLAGEKPETPPDQATSGPSYTVEIRRPGYTTQFVRIPHTGVTYLQEALEKSGATQKIRKMELYVLRTPPQGGPRQRLTAVYDVAARRVTWESDYAIYPGDHIVVTEDTSTDFDHLLNKVLGPLGRG